VEKNPEIIDKFFTPRLNTMCKTMIMEGPTEDEITLLTVLAIMDELLREITNTEYRGAAMQAYKEVEIYLDKEGFSQ